MFCAIPSLHFYMNMNGERTKRLFGAFGKFRYGVLLSRDCSLEYFPVDNHHRMEKNLVGSLFEIYYKFLGDKFAGTNV